MVEQEEGVSSDRERADLDHRAPTQGQLRTPLAYTDATSPGTLARCCSRYCAYCSQSTWVTGNLARARS